MRKVVDLTGQRFGRLTVLERAPNQMVNLKSGRKMSVTAWRCKCDCGGEKVIVGSSLKSGYTRSCGCLEKENRVKLLKTHGLTDTRLHRIWSGMKARCNRKTCPAYPNYGGRGITVCSEWEHSFIEFYNWAISHGYRDDLSIDRINNDKGYSPDNCRWATRHEQRINQRPRRKKYVQKKAE